mmetsp:Transcript_48984/g.158692  ORF Transcript_48984/g.158692 Transcript_48984/m.158692 type:complete len:245 (-) Transcript_48984:759-1493(-)
MNANAPTPNPPTTTPLFSRHPTRSRPPLPRPLRSALSLLPARWCGHVVEREHLERVRPPLLSLVARALAQPAVGRRARPARPRRRERERLRVAVVVWLARRGRRGARGEGGEVMRAQLGEEGAREGADEEARVEGEREEAADVVASALLLLQHEQQRVLLGAAEQPRLRDLEEGEADAVQHLDSLAEEAVPDAERGGDGEGGGEGGDEPASGVQLGEDVVLGEVCREDGQSPLEQLPEDAQLGA